MILPSKNIKPVDSLVCIGAYVLDILNKADYLSFDDLLLNLYSSYPKKITAEHVYLAINFLYILDKIEMRNDEIIAVN
ncbi:ABC-three component system middle component 6 [Pantoea ananatis]|uniref:ABC-three component system middle component 6 n=1 Tax=Pantoea ananas TaxID=553 RepID=UPI00349FEEEA